MNVVQTVQAHGSEKHDSHAAAEVTAIDTDGEEHQQHCAMTGVQTSAQSKADLRAESEQQSSKQQQPWSNQAEGFVGSKQKQCGARGAPAKTYYEPGLDVFFVELLDVAPVRESACYRTRHHSNGT